MSAHPALPRVLVARGHSYIAFAAGRKYLHAIGMGTPISVVSISFGTPLHRELADATLKGKPYPVRRAARIYLRSKLAATDRAKKVLRELVRVGRP